MIFNLTISNQNCNSDPFLTKLGFTCIIVLENNLASNAVIQPVSAKQHKDALWIVYLNPMCLIWLAKTILDQGNKNLRGNT